MIKYSISFLEKYTNLMKYFREKTLYDTNEFISEHTVWKYLNQIELDNDIKNILRKSFRTRIKMNGGLLDFQFRIDPKILSEYEITEISQIENSLVKKFTILLPKNQIEVHIKLSPCCGKNCFGCTQYGS